MDGTNTPPPPTVVGATFLYPGTGTRNKAFCSSKVIVEWSGYTCNLQQHTARLWSEQAALRCCGEEPLSSLTCHVYLFRTRLAKASCMYWISARPGRKTSTLPRFGKATSPETTASALQSHTQDTAVLSVAIKGVMEAVFTPFNSATV